MKRYPVLIIFILLSFKVCLAQTQSVKDLYFDFLQIRTETFKSDEAINDGLALLQRSKELNDKQVASITYHLGRLYEAENYMGKAIPYYEKSIKLTPGYYVPYRALGFWYFKTVIDLKQKLSRIDQVKNPSLHAKTESDLKKMIVQTVPYLEKSQACDPDEETLSMIVDLYKEVGDKKSLNNLNSRLKLLSENCITLLDDE